MAQSSKFAEMFASTVNSIWNDVDSPISYEGYMLTVEPGRVYDRLVLTLNSEHRSCFAFVVRATGALVKSGGWKAPQKNADGSLAVRYDLSTDAGLTEAAQSADVSGRFLYTR